MPAFDTKSFGQPAAELAKKLGVDGPGAPEAQQTERGVTVVAGERRGGARDGAGRRSKKQKAADMCRSLTVGLLRFASQAEASLGGRQRQGREDVGGLGRK